MKHDGYYYLLAAEGGTGAGHRISAARSKNVWGPYENCPYNPILRQDDAGGYLQNCGHGKLLQTADGRCSSAFSVCAAIRMVRLLWDGKLRLQK